VQQGNKAWQRCRQGKAVQLQAQHGKCSRKAGSKGGSQEGNEQHGRHGKWEEGTAMAVKLARRYGMGKSAVKRE